MEDKSKLIKMKFRCDNCNRNFNSEESLHQHNLVKHSKDEPKKVNVKKYFIFVSIILIIILLILSVNSYRKKPGQYDEFARCLSEKNIIVYGNDYCSYTAEQLNLFGKSKKYLDYIKCVDNTKLCDDKGVDITPTWEINGETYSGIQSLEKLSALSGCEI